MIGEKRANTIEYKAKHQREMLAGVSSTAPINVQVRLQIYSLLWHLKQKYHNPDNPLFYVSKRAYEEDLGKITAIEGRIITDGSDEPRARKAIDEAREYLALVAWSKVRVKDNNRVY